MPIRVYSRESSALSSRFFSGLSSAVCSRLFSVVFEVVLQVVLRCIRGYLPGCSPLYSRLSSVVFRVVLQVVLNGLPGCTPDYPGCPLGFPMGCPPGYPPCCLLDCQGYPSDLLVFFQVSSGVFSWVSLMVYKSLGFIYRDPPVVPSGCPPECPLWSSLPLRCTLGFSHGCHQRRPT